MAAYDRDSAAQEKYVRMTETPVPRLIGQLAVPSVVSMLITSVYTMADTYFVSRIGTSASAAVGVTFALMALIQAGGFLFGQGAGNYVSRLLGQKKNDDAECVLAVGFLTAVAFGSLICAGGLIFCRPLARLLGATPTVLPYALDYTRFILLGAPYMAAAFVLNNSLRAQGNSLFAMVGIGTGGLLNIALDPLLIFKLGLGIRGAALATIFSQAVSFCILLAFSYHPKTPIHLYPQKFRFRAGIYKEIFHIGLPSFYRQSLAAVSTVLMNTFAAPYGDAAIAAMSIVSRVYNFIFAAVLGFGQGYQPVCAFNYGAKRYDRVKRAFRFCVTLATVLFVVLGGAVYRFAPEILALFRREDAAVIAYGAAALRAHVWFLPLLGWTVVTTMSCQSIGKGTFASLLSLAKQGIFFIPLIFALSRVWGMTGVLWSMPLANAATFLLALPIGLRLLREWRMES